MTGSRAPPAPPEPAMLSSALTPGAVFTGSQTSTMSSFDIKMELKQVDIGESYLCGYLTIDGLSVAAPSLTTFWEGEIIGERYPFATRKWNATEATDRAHWERLAPFEAKMFSDVYPFHTARHVFMRWKEIFMVPDHHVCSVSGASFKGFYYVVFDRVTSTFQGLYYDTDCEKYQKLSLSSVPRRDFACFSYQ